MIRNRHYTLALFGAFAALVAAPAVRAQGITVTPITVHLDPGQMTSSLSVINQGDVDSSFQVRAYAWSQKDGTDELTATDAMIASPPLGTIAAHATQTVRLVLRRAPQAQEATYRILLDQIPPANAANGVHIALRLSIPVFVEPATRAVAHLQWRIERTGGQSWLVAVNDGTRHEAIRDIAVVGPGGGPLKVEGNSPYVLAADTHRWRFAASGAQPGSGATMHLTARSDAGLIDQPVPVVGAP